MSLPAKPLAGLKVIELGTLIAGPFASRICAEFGAEVIKIESPDGGDPLRKWRKLYEGTSLWWFVQARNKQSLTLNLKHPEAQAILKQLVAEADILIENFRPGVLEKLGLGWEVLHALNPKLVMVRLSGFGQTGPMKDQPGFGAVGESMGGLRYITGFEDRPPVRTGISIGDSIAALWGVIGALMALRHREVNGGQGQVVDVALYEAVFAMMESLVPEFDVFGFIRERTGNIMPGITPARSTPAPTASMCRSAPTATPSSNASCWPSAAKTWPTIRNWPTTPAAMRGATSCTRRSTSGCARCRWTRCWRCCSRPRCRPVASTAPRTYSATRSSSPATCCRRRSCRTAGSSGCPASCQNFPRHPAAPSGSARSWASIPRPFSRAWATTPPPLPP